MENKKNQYRPQAKFTKKQLIYLKIKRLIDFIMAIVLLVIFFPLMLVVIVCIKIDSKGPVIYKQKRPGYHQKIFSIYKFRSMKVETIGNDGYPLTDKERMTKLGRFLRKTSIDELPQLINIIRGEMSFIGPRPFLINDLPTYNKKQLIRFDILLGINSWTAINGRNNQNIQEKYDQEIYYVTNVGLKIDLQILFKTILLVFSQRDVEDNVTGGRIAANIIEEIKEE